MEFARTLLEQQPLLALFLTVALGYLAGEINVKGFSLGVGAVLVVALGMGWLVPGALPAPAIGTLGLALFLYAVGIQYGRQFFAGLTSRSGLRANAIGAVGVLCSGAVCVLFVHAAKLDVGHALGLFAGAGTNTPALQAAIATLGNDDAAVGYSVSYPIGVAGPILFLYLGAAVMKPQISAPPGTGMELLEIGLEKAEFFGKRLAALVAALPAQVQIVALRRDQQNQPALPNAVVGRGDVLLAVGPSKAALEEAQRLLGEPAPGSISADRRDLDYLRVFASRPGVVGMLLGDLALPGESASVVIHVRRGDADLHARPDLVLEFGDRVGMLANRADFPALRKFFGDSIKGTAEFSYISIGLGMALGFALGALPIPVPGIGKVALGLSGVLVVALVLGNARRTAGLNWTMPLSANLVLRNLGLTLFLAQVGMASGPKFAATIAADGPWLLGLGAAALVALTLPILVLGLAVFRLPYDEVAGIVSGACSNPAILAYANRLTPTDAPDLGYAMIFPGMTILKILFVDVAAVLLSP
jgi:putative transport protein